MDFKPEDLPHLAHSPSVHASAFVAPTAVLVGNVRIGRSVSVWYGAVLRGDLNSIEVGDFSNIQDGCIIHLSRQEGVVLGKYVSIGHRAVVHACHVEDEVLVGMGAILMDGVRIGAGSIVGAGALVTKGMQVPPGSLVLGSPAKVVRSLSVEEQASNRRLAESYVEVSLNYFEESPAKS